MPEKMPMTCEEFEMAGLDLGDPYSGGEPQQAALEHLRGCEHCAALQESWLALRTDLHALGADTRRAEAPVRVEMRLRQEFRIKHRVQRNRRIALFSAWALAGAAVVLVAITWFNWRLEQIGNLGPQVKVAGGVSAGKVQPGGPELGEVLVASNDSNDFTLLPGTMPGALDESTVVHVEMQRGALSALGLTVNEEHVSDWIQVDLLVGSDGQPQAVRLPESTN